MLMTDRSVENIQKLVAGDSEAIITRANRPVDGSWKHNKTFGGFCTKRSVTRTLRTI